MVQFLCQKTTLLQVYINKIDYNVYIQIVLPSFRFDSRRVEVNRALAAEIEPYALLS